MEEGPAVEGSSRVFRNLFFDRESVPEPEPDPEPEPEPELELEPEPLELEPEAPAPPVADLAPEAEPDDPDLEAASPCSLRCSSSFSTSCSSSSCSSPSLRILSIFLALGRYCGDEVNKDRVETGLRGAKAAGSAVDAILVAT